MIGNNLPPFLGFIINSTASCHLLFITALESKEENKVISVEYMVNKNNGVSRIKLELVVYTSLRAPGLNYRQCIFLSQVFDTIYPSMDIAMLSLSSQFTAAGTSWIQSYRAIQMMISQVDNNYDVTNRVSMKFSQN